MKRLAHLSLIKFFILLLVFGCASTTPKWHMTLSVYLPMCSDSSISHLGDNVKTFTTKQDCEQSDLFKHYMKVCDGCTQYKAVEFKGIISYKHRFRCETKNYLSGYPATVVIEAVSDEKFGEGQEGKEKCSTTLPALQKRYVESYFETYRLDKKFLKSVFDFKVVSGLPTDGLILMLGYPSKIEKIQTRRDGVGQAYVYGKSRYFFVDKLLVDWEIVE